MRLASAASVLSLIGVCAVSSLLTGCPEKGGAPADKTVAEPERAEPDDEGKSDEKAKKPAPPAPAAPAAASAAGDDKKPDDAKDEGGW